MANKKQSVEEALLSLLSPIDHRHIVTRDQKGLIYIGGDLIDAGMLSNLRAEAEFFKESQLWKLIYETPKKLAEKAMFVDAETLSDLQKGKTMLYTLDVQKNIVDLFLKK